MNLLALTEAHVAPNRIQTYLERHFCQVLIMQTVSQSDHRFVNLDDLTWLESRKGCTRYATGPERPEHSIWLCDECSDEADPYEGGCPCCDEDDDNEDEEEDA
jgi:hypothetical protein